jgi:hypothetical protein
MSSQRLFKKQHTSQVRFQSFFYNLRSFFHHSHRILGQNSHVFRTFFARFSHIFRTFFAHNPSFSLIFAHFLVPLGHFLPFCVKKASKKRQKSTYVAPRRPPIARVHKCDVQRIANGAGPRNYFFFQQLGVHFYVFFFF